MNHKDQPPVYILDDFVDFLPDEVEQSEECHVSHDEIDNNDQEPVKRFMKKVSLALVLFIIPTYFRYSFTYGK